MLFYLVPHTLPITFSARLPLAAERTNHRREGRRRSRLGSMRARSCSCATSGQDEQQAVEAQKTGTTILQRARGRVESQWVALVSNWPRALFMVLLTTWYLVGSASAAQALSSSSRTRAKEQSYVARSTAREKKKEHSSRTRLVLPSERAYLESLTRRRQRQAVLHRTARIVVPGVLTAGVVVSGVTWYWRHRQRQRAAEFERFLKTALQDLGDSDESDEGDLEKGMREGIFDFHGVERASIPDAAATVSKRTDRKDDLAGRLRLDLSMKPDVVVTDGSSYPPESLEYRIDRFLSGAGGETAALDTAEAKSLQEALEQEQWTLDQLVAVANGCIARVVSSAVEEMRRQAQAVVASDFGMAILVGINGRGTRLAELLPQSDAGTAKTFSERLMYAGRHRNRQDIHDLYRRYVIRTLVQEQPKAEQALRPEDMQRLEESMRNLALLEQMLRIDEQTARGIKDEAARFVFQMAVSATLADPNASVDEAYLKELTKILENMLSPEIAERIRSEVGMMRILYDIEKMVKEGAITAEDKRALRNLCTQLGFNVQDFLDSTAQLKEVLGAEGERYARLFQQIFGDDPDSENLGQARETTETKAVRVETNESVTTPRDEER